MSKKLENTTSQQLTLFAEGFPASLTASQGNGKPAQTNGIYGENLPVSLAKLTPGGLWLKMYQDYSQVKMDGTLEEFSLTWPKSGMMQNGTVFRLRLLGQSSSAKECSLWPTPQASESFRLTMKLESSLKGIEKSRKGGGAVDVSRVIAEEFSAYPTPNLYEWVMGFPQNWTEIE